MKIIIDKSIPFVEGLFEPFGEVVYLPGEEIVAGTVKDADALLIRTRTKVNAELLDQSSVKMVASATMGTDHIDYAYCSEKGIHVQHPFGGTANSVMNYVFSALYGVAARKTINLSETTFGVLGLGNTGSRVAAMARYLGFRVLQCDPAREEIEGPDLFCSQEKLLSESKVVSMHIPLNDQTKGICSAGFFEQMAPGAIFINCAHGELVDEKALIAAAPKLGSIIIDTWKNEPFINLDLMDVADIATPHIAGYSYQGKQYFTAMAVRSIARYFGITQLFDFFPETPSADLEAIKLDLKDKHQGEIASILQYNYPIFSDDFMFRMAPESFVQLRDDYSYRREFYVDF